MKASDYQKHIKTLEAKLRSQSKQIEKLTNTLESLEAQTHSNSQGLEKALDNAYFKNIWL